MTAASICGNEFTQSIPLAIFDINASVHLTGSIACHADNGYGTPMHAQRSIQISRAPKITVALGGDSSNRLVFSQFLKFA